MSVLPTFSAFKAGEFAVCGLFFGAGCGSLFRIADVFDVTTFFVIRFDLIADALACAVICAGGDRDVIAVAISGGEMFVARGLCGNERRDEYMAAEIEE